MAVTIELNHPEFPDGYEFDVGGVLVPNGGSVEVTEEQELVFLAKHGLKYRDGNWGSFVKVSGTTELDSKTVAELSTPVDNLGSVAPLEVEAPEEVEEEDDN